MASTIARTLRANPTDAEMHLWQRLRGKQIAGFRFRRQQPIGHYVVDFFCPASKLVIEVDGGQHVDDEDTRTCWLEANGYRVIRFWNNDVLSNIEGVITIIIQALNRQSPPPGSADALPTSPSRGEVTTRP